MAVNDWLEFANGTKIAYTKPTFQTTIEEGTEPVISPPTYEVVEYSDGTSRAIPSGTIPPTYRSIPDPAIPAVPRCTCKACVEARNEKNIKVKIYIGKIGNE